MRVWKLVSGILCIIAFSFFITIFLGLGSLFNLFQSGVFSGGILALLLLLAGGIMHLVTNNMQSLGTRIALVLIFGIAAYLFFQFHSSSYKSAVNILGVWCSINAFLALIDVPEKEEKETDEETQDHQENV